MSDQARVLVEGKAEKHAYAKNRIHV